MGTVEKVRAPRNGWGSANVRGKVQGNTASRPRWQRGQIEVQRFGFCVWLRGPDFSTVGRDVVYVAHGVNLRAVRI